MNSESKQAYLTRVKYHLTMALRLVENMEDAPASKESCLSLNAQLKSATEAADEMTKALNPPAGRQS